MLIAEIALQTRYKFNFSHFQIALALHLLRNLTRTPLLFARAARSERSALAKG